MGSHITLLDPFERDRVRKRIDDLLKRALDYKNSNNITNYSNTNSSANTFTCGLNSDMMNKLVVTPGTTPLSSSPTTPSPLGVIFSPAQQQQRIQMQQQQQLHLNQPVYARTDAASMASRAINEAVRKRQHGNLWKELYDYFQYFGERASGTEQIDKRLEQDRAKIPLMIADILNTVNFFVLVVYSMLDLV
jgi:hypothetical protein